MQPGEEYDGPLDSDNKPHGHGTLVYKNGTYTGDFKHGSFHGEGDLTLKNGHRYVGSFREGKQHGQGTMHREGTIIKGAFKNGSAHGQVIERNESEGYEYRGNMEFGFREDYGELSYFAPNPKAGEVYSGYFFRGELTCPSGRLTVGGREYTGQLKNGKFKGIVEIVEPDGTSRKAQYDKGVQQRLYAKKKEVKATNRAAMYAAD
eukprot:TRINITY_DN15030_c0_g1_i1.p1 TRINITY_DN15030_c0_g1~~TRINITY_DN15030_c0_g1_i1.p1  ORF type:complete len:218 (+),score=46.01 TRINITY_DN15030_c0_g1_i1:41-655(+)